MPGAYLAAIFASALGVAVLDRRWRLAAWAAPAPTAIAVAVGTFFFVAWDAVGIAAGVFVKGDSPLFIGIDIAPHLPFEEPFFLAFLCYLSLVTWAGARRVLERTRTDASPAPRGEER